MKKLFAVLAALLLLGVMTSCGSGGGGGGSSDGTKESSDVNLKILKGFVYGTAPAGSQMSFNLTGSDTLGNVWNGSWSVVSDGTTIFENKNVTKTTAIFAFTSPSVRTSTSSDYYLASNGAFYKSVDSEGIFSVPSTQNSPIPDNANVGDSGSLGEETSSDGTSSSSTWKLENDLNGNYKFIVSTVNKNAYNVVEGQSEVTLYLDSNGNPYKYKDILEYSDINVTITLLGNRNTATATDDTTTSTSTSSTTTSITSTSSTITTTTRTTTSTTTTTTGTSSGNCETTSDEDMALICNSCTRVDVIRCSDDLDNPEAKMTIQHQGSNGYKSGICDSLDDVCIYRELKKVLDSCGCQTEY